ncbi:MAG: lysylphosphatidylglycerol synthase domain-containing protein [Flavobacteriaceae bacterium]
MKVPFNKAKQYGWFALKVFILALAFLFIYHKMATQKPLAWKGILDSFQLKNAGYFLLFMGFAIANWFFEIKKWQTMVSVLKKISFSEALTQSLAALTVSLATPFRIGDYGAKAFYFEMQQRKQILLLNLISNAFQLFITLVFGSIGLWVSIPLLPLKPSGPTLVGFCCVLVVVLAIAHFYRKKEWFIKGFSIKNMWKNYQKITVVVKRKAFAFSLLRYIIFSSLFFMLLRFFGAATTFWETIPFIWSMYLLASLLPVFSFFDVVIKSSISVGLLSYLGIPEMVVLTTVVSMWLLNFIFPAVLGSVYVLNFKRI